MVSKKHDRASLNMRALNGEHIGVEFDGTWTNEELPKAGSVITYTYIADPGHTKPREPRLLRVHEETCDCTACEHWREQKACVLWGSSVPPPADAAMAAAASRRTRSRAQKTALESRPTPSAGKSRTAIREETPSSSASIIAPTAPNSAATSVVRMLQTPEILSGRAIRGCFVRYPSAGASTRAGTTPLASVGSSTSVTHRVRSTASEAHTRQNTVQNIGASGRERRRTCRGRAASSARRST